MRVAVNESRSQNFALAVKFMLRAESSMLSNELDPAIADGQISTARVSSAAVENFDITN